MKSKKEEREGLEYISLKGHECIVEEYLNTHKVVVFDRTENVRYHCRWMDLHNKRAAHICAKDLSVLEPKETQEAESQEAKVSETIAVSMPAGIDNQGCLNTFVFFGAILLLTVLCACI